MIDLKALSDEELDKLRRDVLADIERRENLERIPDQDTPRRYAGKPAGQPTRIFAGRCLGRVLIRGRRVCRGVAA